MRTVVVGNRKLARHLLRHLLREEWDVVGVLTPKGEMAAKQANFASVRDIVESTSCQLHETGDINADETVEWLNGISPDICICGGWSQIIDKRILTVPTQGFLGLHASRLPEGRGGAPVNWSLIGGAEEVWISLFYYGQNVDAGEIVAQGSVSVEFRDDIATVFDALAAEACQLVSSIRDELERNNVESEPQSLTEASYRPRRQPQDGLINWRRDPATQYDWIRAQTEPYPGAYTFYCGKQVIIWQGEPIERPTGEAEFGEVLAVVDGEGIDVRTGGGVIRLRRIQQDGRPQRWADIYAAEMEMSPGDQFGRFAAPEEWLYTGIEGPSEPTTFETNLSCGEGGTVEIVSFSGSARELSIRALLDTNSIFDRSVTVNEEYREQIEYGPAAIGTHTLKIVFEEDGDPIDTRYLKIFVHE